MNEDQFLALPYQVQKHFKQLEVDTVCRICKHIGDIGSLTATDVHRLEELKRIGYNLDAIQAEIAQTLNISRDEVYRVFLEAAESEYNGQKVARDILGNGWIPFADNIQMQDMIQSIANITHGELVNISKTTGFVNLRGEWKPIANFYQDAVDYAVLQIQTGQTDFNSAMRGVVRKMTEHGQCYVDYASGYRRRMDTSVRSAMMGGLQRMSHQMALINGAQFGADGMEISWHSGHRPSHDFGGQQFTLAEYDTEIWPLMQEPNCYHHSFPIMLGISTPSIPADELARLEAEEETIHEYNGKGYNKYEATQGQRRRETAIRKQKEYAQFLDAAGDKKGAVAARAKARRRSKEYKEFSNAMGLRVKADRTSVPRARAS